MSEWLDGDRPDDAPRTTEHSRRAIVASWLLSRVLYVGVLGYGTYYAATFQDASSGGVAASLPDSAPFEGVLLMCCVLLLPLILVALIAGRRS